MKSRHAENIYRLLFVVIASIFCFGCVFDSIDMFMPDGDAIVSQKDLELYFDYQPKLFNRHGSGYVHRVTVERMELHKSIEPYWSITSEAAPNNSLPVGFPVRYGQKSNSLIERTPAKKLRPGLYRLHLSVWHSRDGRYGNNSPSQTVLFYLNDRLLLDPSGIPSEASEYLQ